jgi:hypothetical protein
MVEASKRSRQMYVAKRRALSDDSEEMAIPISIFIDLGPCTKPLELAFLQQLNYESISITREQVLALSEKNYLNGVVAALQHADTKLEALGCLINISYAPRACALLQRCESIFEALNECVVSHNKRVVVDALYVINNFYVDDDYDVAFLAFNRTHLALLTMFEQHPDNIEIQTHLVCAVAALLYTKMTTDFEQVLIASEAISVLLKPILHDSPIWPEAWTYTNAFMFDEYVNHFLELIFILLEKGYFTQIADIMTIIQFPMQMVHTQPNIPVFWVSLRSLDLVASMFRGADIAIDEFNNDVPLMSTLVQQRGNMGSFTEYMFIKGNFARAYSNFLRTLEHQPTLCSDGMAKDCLAAMSNLIVYAGKDMVMDMCPMYRYLGKLFIPNVVRPVRREHALMIILNAARAMNTPDFYEWVVEKCNMVENVSSILRSSTNPTVVNKCLAFFLHMVRIFPSAAQTICDIPGMVDQLVIFRYQFEHNAPCAAMAEKILAALDVVSDDEDLALAPFQDAARSAFVV